MFDELDFSWPHMESLVVVVLAVSVVLLFWWQDFDGIRSSWEYHRSCRKRERLTGAEFYHRFYEGSGIPLELVTEFRQFHAAYFDEQPDLLHPEDDLFQINSGLDCSDWFGEVRILFGVEMPENVPLEIRAALPVVDQSFDCALRILYLLQRQKSHL